MANYIIKLAGGSTFIRFEAGDATTVLLYSILFLCERKRKCEIKGKLDEKRTTCENVKGKVSQVEW